MLELNGYLDALKAAKQWGLHAHVRGLDAEQRLSVARRCVSEAAAAKDEETAIQQLDLLRLAFDDVQAAALQKEGIASSEAYRDRMYRLQETACAEFAAEAISLWMETPSAQEAPWRPGESRITYVPTLVEYKRKLMELIVQRWRVTDDAAEADSFLDAIIAVMKRDLGAYEFLSLAIRETKGPTRHRDRTLRGILRMIAETAEGGKEDPAKALWLGIARDFNRHELQALAGVLRHVPMANLHQCWTRGYKAQPMLDAVAREAERYRMLHDLIGELRGALVPKKGKLHASEAAYPRADVAEIMLVVIPDTQHADKLKEEFDDTFADLRGQAARWLAALKKKRGIDLEMHLTVSFHGLKLSRTTDIG